MKPSYKPFEKGYLLLGDGHKIYYEACGNPTAPPVLFLHGGPGGGFQEKDKTFFNPKKWKIILFDQRGAGKSKPFASLQANTTQHLVEDIRKVLRHFRIEKTFVFGGSWGSTLALVYAIRYPETVTGMLLRGIFLATKEENRFYYQEGVKHFFPQEYERFMSMVPAREQKDPLKHYLKKMTTGSRKEQDTYAHEYSRYEMSILKLENSEKKILKTLKKIPYLSLGRIEAYYLANSCFIPEAYILKNIQKIKDIPITIVQGRYDVICPPINAYTLHKKLNKAKLYLVTAGHSSSDPAIRKKLISEMRKAAAR
ncbi:MAG: prolyl aminopeptidase [Nanoarchaeota archaeon]